MECIWVKALQGPQVAALGPEPFSSLVIWVILNGREVDALANMGYRRTLVRRARGPRIPEVLQIKCIHEDGRNYLITQVQVAGQWFCCKVGGVPQLDCLVLLRRVCPILAWLLKGSPNSLVIES